MHTCYRKHVWEEKETRDKLVASPLVKGQLEGGVLGGLKEKMMEFSCTWYNCT